MAIIDILLATYNGEQFLSEQIESILNQSFTDWRLLIHDDGSLDGTVNIINKYSNAFPDKIFLIEDSIITGGARNNFYHLLSFSKADYIMFCDQDDVWLSNKVEDTLLEMYKVEKNRPALVYTDLKVVDENLNIISESLRSYQQLEEPKNLKEALLHNCVTGCTMMINKSLLKNLTFPEYSIMHDWWFLIEVFRLDGVLHFINKPTMLYRQHASNEVGAKKSGYEQYVSKMLNFRSTFKGLRYQYVQFNAVLKKGFLHFIFLKVFNKCF